jgi:hypothetical protein
MSPIRMATIQGCTNLIVPKIRVVEINSVAFALFQVGLFLVHVLFIAWGVAMSTKI